MTLLELRVPVCQRTFFLLMGQESDPGNDQNIGFVTTICDHQIATECSRLWITSYLLFDAVLLLTFFWDSLRPE